MRTCRQQGLPAEKPVPRFLPGFELDADLRTQIVTGRQDILALGPLLVALCLRCGQRGAMDHLHYFLTTEDALKKTPHLILLGPDMHRPGARPEDAVAALLIYEYRVLGLGTKVFATDDTSGRRTLIAPETLRSRALDLACTAVMRAGGRIIVMSVLEDACSERGKPLSPIQVNGAWRYTSREREIPSYLQLESTMDATLAKLGQRTRRNMRYYRRRAEAQLGATFVRDARMNRFEFRTFNRECSYAVSDAEAMARYETLARVPGMFLCGTKGADGHWLSVIGGRRYYDLVEIDWQMNREDLADYSLSTVMRAFFIEDEIARGTQKLYMEGGTPHAMRFSFTTDLVRDVGLVKHTWAGLWMRRLILRLLPEKNFVRELLQDEALAWATLG